LCKTIILSQCVAAPYRVPVAGRLHYAHSLLQFCCLSLSLSPTIVLSKDHIGVRLNRRSQTEILISMNSDPRILYSKQQEIVESGTFGSEFMAMKTAKEQIKVLRRKRRDFVEMKTVMF
jgi:hypothetical protein